MILPSNYAALTGPEQLFVVTDVERVDRGVAALAGLTPTLDQFAQAGAVAGTDPSGPAGATWASNWAGGEPTVLAADFGWMYDDGPASPNVGCPPNCWVHRDNILGASGSMGAGVAGTSMTELVVSNYPEAASFTWAQELPYLTAMPMVATSPINVAAAPGTANTSTETVFVAQAATVSASIAGSGASWSVQPSRCSAAAGQACLFSVGFEAAAAGSYQGTLQLSSPTGAQAVPVEAVAGHGYWEASAGGAIYDFGGGGFRGSLGNGPLNQPIVGVAATPDHGGYWLVAADGGVFTFGDAGYFGSTGNVRLNQPVVGMAPTPSGRGYWLVARDGGIFSFGDATFFGSTGNIRLNQPIVGMAADPATGGYWLVAADGGVFAFHAPFLGSAGAHPLNQPVVGMTMAADGRGYRLVARDGGIFTYGAAPFFGSTGNIRLNQPIVGMAADPATGGYWLDAADGGVFAFNAPFLGSEGGAVLARPVVGMVAS